MKKSLPLGLLLSILFNFNTYSAENTSLKASLVGNSENNKSNYYASTDSGDWASKNEKLNTLAFTLLKSGKHHELQNLLSSLDESERIDFLEKARYYGHSLLELAIQAKIFNPYEVIEVLLKQGAKVNTTGDKGDIPLFLAIRSPYPQTVKLLLDYGADFWICQGPYLPLEDALSRGKAEAARLMIQQGAELLHYSVDKTDFSKEQQSNINKLYNLVTKLLEDINQLHFDAPLIFLASIQGDIESFKELETLSLNSEEGSNLTNKSNESEADSSKAKRARVSSHCFGPELFINYRDHGERSALSWATSKGDIKIVEALLNYPEIEINSPDKFSRTALHRAASLRRNDVLKALVEHPRLDINKQDKSGRTALHWAALSDNAEAVKILLTHTDINARLADYNGMSALACAQQLNFSEIVNLIHIFLDTKIYGISKFSRMPMPPYPLPLAPGPYGLFPLRPFQIPTFQAPSIPTIDLHTVPVGVMANIVRNALQNGHKPYSEISHAELSQSLAIPQIEPGRLEARVLDFYSKIKKPESSSSYTPTSVDTIDTDDDQKHQCSQDRKRSRRDSITDSFEYKRRLKTTESASSSAPASIPVDNIGHQMLRGMGWQEGKGLGQSNSGIIDPVQALENKGRVGVGGLSKLSER